MLIYFLVLLIPLILGLVHPRYSKTSYVVFWLFFLALLIFCGFRYEVGTDWLGYLSIYENSYFLTLADVLDNYEPGFALINMASYRLGFEFTGVVFSTSLIFLYGCFVYARQTTNPWLAVATVMPYLIFIISLSGIRQACSIGIGFYLFAKWERFTLVRKLVFVLLAISLHNSAVILLFFVVVSAKSGLLTRAVLLILVTVLLGFNLNSSTAVAKYQYVYLDQNLISEGAFFHMLLIAFPSALYLFYRKQLEAFGVTNRNVFWASLLTIALMPLLAVSSTGVDRLSLYLSFVQMWVYPALLHAGVVNRGTIRVSIGMLVMTIFFVYFLFGNYIYAYIPYQNIIF
jgi:hypothetical protein